MNRNQQEHDERMQRGGREFENQRTHGQQGSQRWQDDEFESQSHGTQGRNEGYGAAYSQSGGGYGGSQQYGSQQYRQGGQQFGQGNQQFAQGSQQFGQGNQQYGQGSQQYGQPYGQYGQGQYGHGSQQYGSQAFNSPYGQQGSYGQQGNYGQGLQGGSQGFGQSGFGLGEYGQAQQRHLQEDLYGRNYGYSMGYEHNPRGQQGFGQGSYGSQGASYGGYGSQGLSSGRQYGQGSSMGPFEPSGGSYGSRTSFAQEYNRAMRHEPQGGYDTGFGGSFGSSSGYGQSNQYGSGRGSQYDQQYMDQGASGQGGWLQSLRGKGPKGYTRSDERLKEDICERLTHHPAIDASDVEIEAKQGVVTLTGSVTQRQAKHQIEDLVEDVSGVKDIENRISVRPQSQSSQSQQQLGSGSLGGSSSRGQSASGSTSASGSSSGSTTSGGTEAKPKH